MTTEDVETTGQALQAALSLRGEAGTLHLTISLPIAVARMQAQAMAGETCFWNRDLLSALHGSGGKDDYQDSCRLSQAIEPLFNDIADRRRGLFIEDFLLDTPSLGPQDFAADTERGDRQNVCDVVELELPAELSWETEGERFGLALSGPVRLQARCRAFWVAHSNTSLSYHLSLEVRYRHRPADYYALSLLQKSVFPSEGTDWVQDVDKGLRIHSRHAFPQDPPRSLRDYVAALFDLHAGHLLGGIRDLVKHAHGVDLATPAWATRPWQSLVLDDTPEPDKAGEPDPPPRPALGQLQCRAVILLRDPYFFCLLDRRIRDELRDFAPVEALPGDGIVTYSEQSLRDGLPAEQLDYYFLSGFLQNIVDFLRQDESEVQDGTDPIYPPADIRDDNSHFLVYATQNTVYEIIAGTRSLEVGRGWIGTCPYLFLVHLMTMHNEALVRQYEDMVRALISKLKHDGLLDPNVVRLGKAYATRAADEAFEAFRSFRLDTFNRIAQHRYFNVLRYDTERAFYESIEAVRGISQREEYWGKVVENLETAVDDLRGNEQQKSEKFLGRVLFYVAFLGMLQLVFQFIDLGLDGEWVKLRYAALATVATVVVMLVLFHSRGLIDSHRWSRWLQARRRRNAGQSRPGPRPPT